MKWFACRSLRIIGRLINYWLYQKRLRPKILALVNISSVLKFSNYLLPMRMKTKKVKYLNRTSSSMKSNMGRTLKARTWARRFLCRILFRVSFTVVIMAWKLFRRYLFLIAWENINNLKDRRPPVEP